MLVSDSLCNWHFYPILFRSTSIHLQHTTLRYAVQAVLQAVHDACAALGGWQQCGVARCRTVLGGGAVSAGQTEVSSTGGFTGRWRSSHHNAGVGWSGRGRRGTPGVHTASAKTTADVHGRGDVTENVSYKLHLANLTFDNLAYSLIRLFKFYKALCHVRQGSCASFWGWV